MQALLIIILLLLINAFFVAAEFALVKARGVRIQHLANEGNRSAQLTVRIHANLEQYLAACQLGITMASLGLGWVGEPAVAAILEPFFQLLGLPEEVLHTAAFLIGFLLFSSLHIVVGEQVPKTLAIRRAEQVSLWVAYPLRWSYLLVWPLNWLLNATSRAILSFFNVEEATHGDIYSNAEFKDLVSTSREQGAMETQKADMLHNMLDFDQRPVSSVMIPRDAVQVLELAKDEHQNQLTVLKSGHSRFPLLDSAQNDEVCGLVLAKSLFLATLDGNSNVWSSLKDFSLDALVIPETQQIASLFNEMRESKVHMAIVVDEYAHFTGIVTLEDLMEEIVGEIEDEQDEFRPNKSVTVLSENRWQVDGMTSLLDLQREIGLPGADYPEINTVSGLVLRELQRIPAVGDSVAISGFLVTVTEMSRRRIAAVEVQREVAEGPLPGDKPKIDAKT